MDPLEGVPDPPLFLAMEENNEEMFKQLLSYCKTDELSSKVNHRGMNALHVASYIGNSSYVSQLISAGFHSNINSQCTTTLETALLIAIKQSNFDVFMLLLNNDANPNIDDINGQFPVHIAARRGQLYLLDLMKSSGAVFNVCDKHNNTPMHRCFSVPVLEYLVDEGVDPFIKNDKGLMALDIVQNNSSVCETLVFLMKKWKRQHASANLLMNFINGVIWNIEDVSKQLGFKLLILVLLICFISALFITICIHGINIHHIL